MSMKTWHWDDEAMTFRETLTEAGQMGWHRAFAYMPVEIDEDGDIIWWKYYWYRYAGTAWGNIYGPGVREYEYRLEAPDGWTATGEDDDEPMSALGLYVLFSWPFIILLAVVLARMVIGGS